MEKFRNFSVGVVFLLVVVFMLFVGCTVQEPQVTNISQNNTNISKITDPSSPLYVPIPPPKSANTSVTSSSIANATVINATALLPNGCQNVTNPVCGSDGKTYQNACVAKESSVEVAQYYACGNKKAVPETVVIIDAKYCNEQSELLVCGVISSGKQVTFRNNCMADLLKATNVVEGACPK